jgi:arylsulfatase A-like enzyme
VRQILVRLVRSRRLSRAGAAGLALALGFVYIGCNRTGDRPATIRLTDHFHRATVEGTPVDVAEPEPLDWWQFGQEPPPEIPADARSTWGWKALDGVNGFNLRDGRLSGRSVGDLPVLAAPRFRNPDDDDPIHSIEVRMRATAGGNLLVSTMSESELDPRAAIGQLRSSPFRDQSPIIAGEGFQTYTIVPRVSPIASGVKHLLLVPTDAADADFEIESIRLVSRREHLSRTPSGVGWQGLAEIYRESVVARTPEVIRLSMTLPDHPWLDFSLGKIDHPPVTFKVSVSSGSTTDLLLERTVTTSQRWEHSTVDLSKYAGRSITLNLALEAASPGQLGLWGGVSVRNRAPKTRQASTGGGRPGSEPPQGVILLMADTLRRDHLNFGGYHRETAPFLKSLAESGALFTDNISQAAWTKVSTPSLMTGMLPTSLRVKEIPDRLPAQALTLAEIFHSAGYATAAYSSVPFTGKLTNLHQGFEELHEVTSVHLPDGLGSKTAREYVDRLSVWLERHRDDPFFVFLHVFDPHDPFEPFEPYNGLWADLRKKAEHKRKLETVRPHIEDPLLRRFGMPARHEFEAAGVDGDAYVSYEKDWYDGSIRAMDKEIERLVQRLGQLGLDRRTLLVFTSDHGEEFLEHGRTFHGQSLYGELTNVPLFFHQDGLVPPGVVVDHTVRNLDVMPTILELSGMTIPPDLAGQSLVPVIAAAARFPGRTDEILASARAAGWEGRPAIAEKPRTRPGQGPGSDDSESFAIVMEGWKLIHHTLRPEGVPEFELFRHLEDPLNLRNVADRHPDVVGRLAEELEVWRQAALAAQLPETDATDGLSKEELDRLRSLGYIQ